MGHVALIDGDVVAHRCAFSCEPSKNNPVLENEHVAIARTTELLHRILAATQTSEYRLFVSGSENFRKLIYPLYKSNRDGVPKPRHLDTLRSLLVNEWGAEVCAGYEADDGIGIAAQGDFIICSNDKDFRQITGRHYNFVKDTHETIPPDESALAFWSHMLIGDTSDNVRGVDGLGKVKSRRLLLGCSPEEMEARVRECYDDDERFLLNRRLLRILRSEEEYWELIDALDLRDENKVSESQRTALAAEGEG